MELKLRRTQCKTCAWGAGKDRFTPYTLDKLNLRVLSGVNQICHGTGEHICQGGRKFVLRMWFLWGWIDAPTDEALFKALEVRGLTPKYTEYDQRFDYDQ